MDEHVWIAGVALASRRDGRATPEVDPGNGQIPEVANDWWARAVLVVAWSSRNTASAPQQGDLPQPLSGPLQDLTTTTPPRR